MEKRTEIGSMLENPAMPTRAQQMKVMAALAWPAILEQVMVTLVHYIDTAMVGSLGAQATAAIGINSSTIWLLNGLLSAMAVGISVQVAQYYGANRQQEARHIVGQACWLGLYVGVVMAGITILVAYLLPGFMRAEQAIRPDATSYMLVIGCTMPFTLASLLFSSVLRSMGDMRTPMVLNSLINVFNVVFNFLLIYPSREITWGRLQFTMPGAGLGVTGAALGSMISMFIVALLFFIVLLRRRILTRQTLRNSIHFTKGFLSTTVRLGIPVALERAALSVAQIVITRLISGIGTVAVAANHLAVTAEGITYMPASGVAAAATTLVGQSVGAKRRDLAISFARLSTYLGMGIMAVTGLILFLFAQPLMRIFTSDPEVLVLGAQVLRIVAVSEPLFGASMVVAGALRGGGDTNGPFVINLVSMWGVRIILSMLLAPRLGLIGVWIAMAVELMVRGAIFLVRLFRNRWIKESLV